MRCVWLISMLRHNIGDSYIAKAQKIMRTTLNEKMLAIPTARQMIMERIPSLYTSSVSRLLRRSSFGMGHVAKWLNSSIAMIEAVYSRGTLAYHCP